MHPSLAGKSNKFVGKNHSLDISLRNTSQALVRIRLLECYLLSEVSACIFYLLLLFYRLLSVTFISESLKLPFRWIDGSLILGAPLSMLLFLGTTTLRFSIGAKMLLLFEMI